MKDKVLDFSVLPFYKLVVKYKSEIIIGMNKKSGWYKINLFPIKF